MSRQMEDRLRAAYEAKAEQVTAERLEQLAGRRQQSLLDGSDGWQDRESSISLFDGSVTDPDEPAPLDLDDRPAGRPHARWLAPALAAAAVAAIAVAVTAVATSTDNGKPTPHPPASQIGTPSPSVTQTPSSVPSGPPTPSITPSQTRTSQSTQPALPYLPTGKTGSRDQVPWPIVGSGWRLLQLPGSRSLYLYDPAAGRYLITDRLPSGSRLTAWSPDSGRALVTTTVDRSGRTTLFEVDLRTGAATAEANTNLTAFVSYAADGGSYLVSEPGRGTQQLSRYSVSGKRLVIYPQRVGKDLVDTVHAVEFAGGKVAVGSTSNTVVFDDAGHYLRSLPAPAGVAYCQPLKSWSATSVLTKCFSRSGSGSMLLIQPLTGAAPSTLTSMTAGVYGFGYTSAWALSNGDILLLEWADCGASRYAILPRNGAIRQLRGPHNSTGLSNLIDEEGDSAVFVQQDKGCGHGNIHFSTVQYQLTTGQTYPLFDGLVAVASWPGGPSGVE